MSRDWNVLLLAELQRPSDGRKERDAAPEDGCAIVRQRGIEPRVAVCRRQRADDAVDLDPARLLLRDRSDRATGERAHEAATGTGQRERAAGDPAARAGTERTGRQRVVHDTRPPERPVPLGAGGGATEGAGVV